MNKLVLLTAKTTLGYAGQRLGLGMQFYATRDDADRLITSGEAVLASEDGKQSDVSTAPTAPAARVKQKPGRKRAEPALPEPVIEAPAI